MLKEIQTPKQEEIINPQEEYRRLLAIKAKRLNEQKYRYYEPCGKIEEFIIGLSSLKYFVSVLSAANGIGKSVAAVNILAHLFWPCGQKYFQGPMFQEWPFPKLGRIVTDPNNIDFLIGHLKFWFPAGYYEVNKRGKSYEKHWVTNTGWEFEIMSYEQDPKEFEGPTLGFVWFDEPPPESIYKACIARLRKGGVCFMTETPLKGSAWIYDQILTNPDNEAGKRFYIEAEIEDACKQHGVRGHLEHEHIQNMIAQYSEEDKQARIYGKPQHLTGLIFKQFAPKIHVIKPFLVTSKDFTVYEFLDPHPRNPDAVLWAAVDRKGTKYLIDELYLKCQGGDKELAQRIKAKASNYRVEGRYCDPSAFIEDQHRQTSLAKKLNEYGLNYIPATKERVMSDRAIGNALSFQEQNGQLIIEPELYIFETNQRCIWEFQHYSWQEWSGKSQDSHGKSEKRMDKDDHFIENIGRFLYSNPQFIEMPIENYSDEQIVFDPYK